MAAARCRTFLNMPKLGSPLTVGNAMSKAATGRARDVIIQTGRERLVETRIGP
jgi:hypothetical protein